MEFLSIQNFKYGLDTRRSIMTSTPGVLAKLENAHVNAGAEIEKRKSFFRSAVGFPDTTFGLEATAQGLVTFGSVADPGDLPGGVTYVQLTSPSPYGPDGGTDDMLGVTYSCNFNGKAFVIAEFESGTYAFYDGEVVPSSYAGRVLYGSTTPGEPMTVDQIANALVAQIETIPGWDAENKGGGIVEITSPPGVYFTAVSGVGEDNEGTGAISDVVMIQQNDPGMAPVGATARFKVINGSSGTPGTFTLTAFSDKPGTVPIGLTLAPVTRVGDNTHSADTAAAIVTAVNYYTLITGYTAIIGTDNVTVIIVAPPTLGVVTFNLSVETSEDDDTDVTTSLGGLTVNVDSTYAVKEYKNSLNQAHDTFSTWVHALASEGIVTYHFAWVECEFDGSTIGTPTGVVPQYPTKAGTNFHQRLEINTFVNAYFKCTVTDSDTPTPSHGDSPIVHVLLSNMKV